MPTWALALVLAGLLGLMQCLLLLATRGLGLRLSRPAIAAGLLLPFLLLLPWIGREPILAPLGALAVPGGPALPEPDPHSILNDTVFQFFPWELEVRHAWKAGRLPLWSDLADGGSSPWVNPQAGALSPIAMLTRALPIQHFLLAALALKVLVAFEGAWLLARRVGASRLAALLAGGGFALGGGILAWGLFPHTQAAAWVPWVATGAIGLVRRPRRLAVATTAVLTAVMLLSGHPETAANGGLFAAGCALLLRRRGRPLLRSLGHAALAAALGFALAAPQLLAFVAAVPGSQRARDMAEHTAGGLVAGPRSWSDPGSWFFEGRGRFLLAPLDRQVFGRPYAGAFTGALSWPDSLAAYAGVVALGGALAALFVGRGGSRRRRTAGPFLLLGGLFLLLASHLLPLLEVLFLVPPLRLPAYARLLILVPLALAVAAALGLDALLRARGRGWGGWLGLALATGLGVAAGAGAASFLLWAGVWLAVLAARWKPGLRRAAYAALGVVLLADLLPWARAQLPRGPSALFYPRTGVVEAVAREAGSGGPWRAVGHDLLAYPGVLSVFGIADPRPHNPMAPAAQLAVLGPAFDFAPDLVRYFAPFRRPDQPLLDFLNVRVLISNRYLPPPATFERIDSGGDEPYEVWRNPDALPRYFLAAGADVAPAAEIPARLAAMTDPRRVLVAAEEAGSWRPLEGSWGAVETRRATPGRLVLALPPGAASGERLLATSLPSPEGWRAKAAGARLETLAVNAAYLGVMVPATATEVELSFVPRGFVPGVVLAVLGVAGVVITVFRAPRKK